MKNEKEKTTVQNHPYTLRFSETEFSDLSRIAGEQGIPVTRVIRLGLAYLYAHMGYKEEFNNIEDVSLLLKEKLLQELK